MEKKFTEVKCSEVMNITDKVWVTGKSDEFDKPLLGIINGSERSIIIDAGASAEHVEELKEAISKIEISAPSFCVITHAHFDHFLGMAYLDIPTIAHKNILEDLENFSKIEWNEEAIEKKIQSGEIEKEMIEYIKISNPDLSKIKIKLPDITFEGKLTINLGNTDCIVEHLICDHSKDSVVVYVPQDKVIFVGDGIYVGPHDNGFGYKLETIKKMKEQLLSYDAEYYIISHDDEVPMSREKLEKKLNSYIAIGEIAEKYRADKEKVISEIEKEFGNENLKQNEQIAQFFIDILD